MSKLTTEDCKNFLVNHYKKFNVITKTEGWKRVKKYKVDDNYHRDFEHAAFGIITVKEENGNLEIVSKKSTSVKAHVPKIKPNQPSLASMYPGMEDDSGDQLIGGSVEKTIESYMGKGEKYTYLGACEEEDDGYGTLTTCHCYNHGSRDVSLLVYEDGSWIITSD